MFQVLAVHPMELLRIEDRRVLLQPLERERLHQLRDVEEQLAVAAGTPAEEREEVRHRLRQDPLVLIVGHGGGAVALAELLAVGAEDHRHVAEDGHRRPEGMVYLDLLRRVRDVVVAAEDVRDPHRDVVGDHREVVHRRPVGAEDDEVLEVLPVEGDRPVDRVLPRHLLVAHPEADRPVVEVRLPFVEEAARIGLVPREPGALEDRTFVPREAEPRHPVEDDPRELVGGALACRCPRRGGRRWRRGRGRASGRAGRTAS